MANGMFLSIIIPTINRYPDLINTLADLDRQSYRDFEILIIDQTKGIEAPEFEKLNQRVRYFRQEKLSASKARNTGIENARGDVLLFIDDDVIIKNPDFLLAYITSYEKNPALPGVTGPVLSTHNPALRYQRHWLSKNKDWGWLFFPPNYGNQCTINSAISCNMSVKRQYAIAVGGMDENFEKGAHREESDFNERITQKYGPYLYNPDCVLWHIGNPVGGIRTWKDIAVKSQHHFDSSWYFLFRNIRLIHYPPHLVSMVLYFIVFDRLISKPKSLMTALFRIIKGFFNARRMIRKKPGYITRNK